jgi:hypothetical protein
VTQFKQVGNKNKKEVNTPSSSSIVESLSDAGMWFVQNAQRPFVYKHEFKNIKFDLTEEDITQDLTSNQDS